MLMRFCSTALLLVAVLLSNNAYVSAQEENSTPGIDLMLVIDNSCSMFAAEVVPPGLCTDTGNDPRALRLTSAHLFISRLGFAEANAESYQLGALNLGANEQLFAPLQPLDQARSALINAVANPQPNTLTRIVPALRAAADELKSERRREGNLPAMVVLTDGGPFPREGQGQAEIEQALSEAGDIRLFLLLLIPEEGASGFYAEYVSLWQDLQLRFPNLAVYTVSSADNLLATYNEIAANLGQTVPRGPISLAPGQTHSFFVSAYTRRIIVTAVGEQGQPLGQMQLLDAQGRPVLQGEPGVERFEGEGQPIEIFSVASPRLAPALLNSMWTIQASAGVSLFVDTQGTYRIDIVEPAATRVGNTDEYAVASTIPAGQPLDLRMRLLDEGSAPVVVPQLIQADLLLADGTRVPLPGIASSSPGSDGVYSLPIDFAAVPGGVPTQPTRLSVELSASTFDTSTATQTVVSRAVLRLIVDPAAQPLPEATTTTAPLADTPTASVTAGIATPTVSVSVTSIVLQAPEQTETPVVTQTPIPIQPTVEPNPLPACNAWATLQRAFWLPTAGGPQCSWQGIARFGAIALIVLSALLLLLLIVGLICLQKPLPRGYFQIARREESFRFPPLRLEKRGAYNQSGYFIKGQCGEIKIFNGRKGKLIATVKRDTQRNGVIIRREDTREDKRFRKLPDMIVVGEGTEHKTRIIFGLDEAHLLNKIRNDGV